MIAEPQHHQSSYQQHERLECHDQTLADEQSHFFDVVGGAHHELASLIAVQVAEGQPLNAGEELVADIERDVLGDTLGVVLLAEGEHGAHRAEDDYGQHGADQSLGYAGAVGLHFSPCDD